VYIVGAGSGQGNKEELRRVAVILFRPWSLSSPQLRVLGIDYSVALLEVPEEKVEVVLVSQHFVSVIKEVAVDIIMPARLEENPIDREPISDELIFLIDGGTNVTELDRGCIGITNGLLDCCDDFAFESVHCVLDHVSSVGPGSGQVNLKRNQRATS
jgi:hypothetical protein